MRAILPLLPVSLLASFCNATEYTVPGPSGETLGYYLSSPGSPLSAGDTLLLTDSGSYDGNFVVTTADLTIRAMPGHNIEFDGELVDAVFTVEANSLTLIDLTITRGLRTGGFEDGGGGIRSIGHDVSVSGCHFEGNRVAGTAMGGAIYVRSAALLVDDCSFHANRSQYAAAAIFVDAGSTITTADATISNSTFTENASDSGGTSQTAGGAVRFWYADGQFLISSCEFTMNSHTGGGGGAIRTGTSLVGIIDCTFEQNVATGSGGAVSIGDGGVECRSSRFIDNQAGLNGGAVGESSLTGSPDSAADTQFVSCLFAENSAGTNGGAYDAGHDESGSTLIFTNCTMVDNNASDSGGAIRIRYEDRVADVRNCIIRGNTPDHFGGDGDADVMYSNVEDGAAGTGNIDAFPLFADSANGDYTITENSRCIDAGDTGYFTTAALPSDAGGEPRIVTATDDPTGVAVLGLYVDQGCYEYQPTAVDACPADLDNNGVLNFDDIDAFVDSFLAGCG